MRTRGLGSAVLHVATVVARVAGDQEVRRAGAAVLTALKGFSMGNPSPGAGAAQSASGIGNALLAFITVMGQSVARACEAFESDDAPARPGGVSHDVASPPSAEPVPDAHARPATAARRSDLGVETASPVPDDAQTGTPESRTGGSRHEDPGVGVAPPVPDAAQPEMPEQEGGSQRKGSGGEASPVSVASYSPYAWPAALTIVKFQRHAAWSMKREEFVLAYDNCVADLEKIDPSKDRNVRSQIDQLKAARNRDASEKDIRGHLSDGLRAIAAATEVEVVEAAARNALWNVWTEGVHPVSREAIKELQLASAAKRLEVITTEHFQGRRQDAVGAFRLLLDELYDLGHHNSDVVRRVKAYIDSWLEKAATHSPTR